MAVKLGIKLLHRRLLAAFFSLSLLGSGIVAVPNRSQSCLIPALCSAHKGHMFGYKAAVWGQLRGWASKLLMVGSLRKAEKALMHGFVFLFPYWAFDGVKACKVWAMHS